MFINKLQGYICKFIGNLVMINNSDKYKKVIWK